MCLPRSLCSEPRLSYCGPRELPELPNLPPCMAHNPQPLSAGTCLLPVLLCYPFALALLANLPGPGLPHSLILSPVCRRQAAHGPPPCPHCGRLGTRGAFFQFLVSTVSYSSVHRMCFVFCAFVRGRTSTNACETDLRSERKSPVSSPILPLLLHVRGCYEKINYSFSPQNTFSRLLLLTSRENTPCLAVRAHSLLSPGPPDF